MNIYKMFDAAYNDLWLVEVNENGMWRDVAVNYNDKKWEIAAAGCAFTKWQDIPLDSVYDNEAIEISVEEINCILFLLSL